MAAHVHLRPLFLALILSVAALPQAASIPGSLAQDLHAYVHTPAVSGYESTLLNAIASELQPLAPVRDNLGDVIVTIHGQAGPNPPFRLIATAVDEPGYIVSAITPSGYLRLQRLPTRGLFPQFNQLNAAQPMQVETTGGRWRNAVMAGLSIHLQPGRLHAPDPGDLDNLYLDIGADTPAQVRAAGVRILSPVARDRHLYLLGGGLLSAPAITDRYGAAALVEVLRRLDPAKLRGTLVVAFLAQQQTGARGLARVRQMLAQQGTTPAQTIFVGPYDVPLRDHAITNWDISTSWSNTPAAIINGNDLIHLVTRLETALGQVPVRPTLPTAAMLPNPPLPPRPKAAPSPEQILRALVPLYGVDPAEHPVRQAIERLLPPWAHPIEDEAGNLTLHWADNGGGAPGLLFAAHQDEIGFQVTAITPDGRLALRTRGGGDLNYFVGHQILVHTAAGMRPGVIELPPDWQSPGFEIPRAFAGRGRGGRGTEPSSPPAKLLADIGARTPAAVAQLGVTVGDTVTIPKQYRRLLGTRASARALDDRVGDAALIAAAWALGPHLPGRDVTFAWTVGEEVGLDGARAMAQRLAAGEREPNYVFGIDTFVSSDSPLESHRFADVPLGSGIVIRAVDDASITPWTLARRLRAMAQSAGIPVHLGATGGGTDASAFVPYGSIALPLGWPLRYSHSPGELIDTKDLDSLTHMLQTLARQW